MSDLQDRPNLDNIKKICSLVAFDDFKHGTADPIFLVQQKIRSYGIECGLEDGYEWFDKGRQEIIEGLRAKRLSLLDDNGRDVSKKYVQLLYQERWEFVTCCFTREGAENFIYRQKHNPKETRIWVDSLFRNQEMIDIRNTLKSIGESK